MHLGHSRQIDPPFRARGEDGLQRTLGLGFRRARIVLCRSVFFC